MKKALLIGINYYSLPDITLNGCVRDIINMRNMLIDAYNFSQNNIIMLRDDVTNPSSQPTRANILSAITSLVSQSSSLEELWIHYSGHGSQIPDFNKDEAGGYDSILVPIDYRTKGFIVDDELLNIIKNSKCRTVILSDSCHSGTVFDLPYSYEFQIGNTFSRTLNNNSIMKNPNIFMFSGCKDSQTSADTYNTETLQAVGAFTDAFINCLRNKQHNTSFISLYRDVCNYLIDKGYDQKPIFSSSSPLPTSNIIRASPGKIAPTPTIKSIMNTTNNSMSILFKNNMFSVLRL
jgi:metacaspase-1